MRNFLKSELIPTHFLVQPHYTMPHGKVPFNFFFDLKSDTAFAPDRALQNHPGSLLCLMVLNDVYGSDLSYDRYTGRTTRNARLRYNFHEALLVHLSVISLWGLLR